MFLSDPFAGSHESGNLRDPRLRNLYNLYIAKGGWNGIPPRARFTSVLPYLRTVKNANPENFALSAANNFGLLVVKIDAAVPLTWRALVDVIWVPAGALAVRVIPRADLYSRPVDISRASACFDWPRIGCSATMTLLKLQPFSRLSEMALR